MKITKLYLDYQNQKTNALIFLPEDCGSEQCNIKAIFAILTHGYTADKGSILNWAIRLTEAGISCVLFDLPGHYLGNYSEVLDFDYFKNHGHELFYTAFLSLQNSFKNEFPNYLNMLEPDQLKLVLAGHSLGAMFSLKALMLPEFKKYQKLSIGVGLGMAPKDIVHLFDTPFYKSTLKIREQLVSHALRPEVVFPWIKEEKEKLDVYDSTIHLITGADDIVVGEEGLEKLCTYLIAKNNSVTREIPKKLPHHEPQLAASYLKKHLKNIKWI